MENQEQTPIEILDSILNITQSLPLDAQHHAKQIILNDKLYKKLNKKKIKNQKKILKKCKDIKLLSKYDDKIASCLRNKLNSAEAMQKIVGEIAEKIKEKLVSIGEEGTLDLPDISNIPNILRIGTRKDTSKTEETFCICAENSYGDMICCDGEDCKIGWYHFGCVGLCNAPKGSWLCETCKRKKRKNK